MDSHRTSHILLTIAVVGILFLIFLFMKERYWNEPTPTYQPIVQEEPVYVPLTNNPVNPPVTNPNPTPNPTPEPDPTPNPTTPTLTISNIEFSAGDHGVIGYAEDSNYNLWYVCANNATEWRFSRSYDDDECGTSDELKVQKYNLEVFLKSEQDKSILDALNARYGITSAKIGSSYQLTLPQTSAYNSLEISKAYFSTGYFEVARPIAYSDSDLY